MPDIDIDFADRDVVLSKIPHRIATINAEKKTQHRCIRYRNST